MGIRIVVTVKQVPDTSNISGEIIRSDGTMDRARLPAIFNPEDLNALETALCLRDQLGGIVVAITMGPKKAIEVLKDCLSRGVDDAILVSDGKFAGADTLATSYVLKCAIEKIGKFDLIICGRQAIDGDTAQVGPQLAEKLGINQITNVSEIINATPESLEVKRNIENGYQVVKCIFPALLTVNSEINYPRPKSVKKVCAYKNIDTSKSDSDEEKRSDYLSFIKEWDAKMVGAESKFCGLKGSPTQVNKIERVVLTTDQTKIVGSSELEIKELITELVEDHIII